MSARLIMKMRVAETRDEAPDVRVITFRHPRRSELPEASPGAHLDLHLPDGKVRQYSLCGDPEDRSCYQVAVKREEAGGGGSQWVHENLVPGAEAHVSTPRNNFPLQPEARAHIFVAGGIGITPFIAMVYRLTSAGADYTLHYCSRYATPPFLELLSALCGDRLSLHLSGDPRSARFDAEEVFRTVVPGAHIYCCGPPRLNDAVRGATEHWPQEQIHFENFQPIVDENFVPQPFEIQIASTGKVLEVPADRSALDVLRANGMLVPSSCEIGVCGSCECSYSDGEVIHRDSVLSAGERRNRMTPCVSRARSRVTLDL